MKRLPSKKQRTIGWFGLIITALLANLWTFWGINENFHEGWYSESLLENLLMLFGQYLLVPIIFIALGLIAIKWPRLSALIYFSLALLCFLFFGKRGIAAPFFIATPLAILGLLFLFGKVTRRRIAYLLVLGLPILQIFGFGTFHYVRVSQRYDDGYLGMRRIEGNNIKLIVAPKGPGWPDNGKSWEEAKWICAHLNEDGTQILEVEVNLWRLPTVDEAVRLMVHHGKNAGGEWDPILRKARYKFRPDKESPLWDVHSKTIYLWTSTEYDEDEAYIIAYNGKVRPEIKTRRADYLNFRAVKEGN